MPSGVGPTGIVAITARDAVSMTDTLAPFRFVT